MRLCIIIQSLRALILQATRRHWRQSIMKKTKINKLNVLEHNGINIEEYPDNTWELAPFPSQKGAVYNADNLATTNRHCFLLDEEFKKYLKLSESRWPENKKRDISWRLKTFIWAVDYALNTFGDKYAFIECGTGQGYMAASLAKRCVDKNIYPEVTLIDTFDNDLATSPTTTVASPADFAYCNNYEEVKLYFNRYQNISTLCGFIPHILNSKSFGKVSFLHIDLNNAAAELAALDFFDESLVAGAIILLDDYGGHGGDEQAQVHEDFARRINRALLPLPTGQAIIIK